MQRATVARVEVQECHVFGYLPALAELSLEDGIVDVKVIAALVLLEESHRGRNAGVRNDSCVAETEDR